jgi:hypothetical protein
MTQTCDCRLGRERKGGDVGDGFAAFKASFFARLSLIGIFAGLIAGCVDTAMPAPDASASATPVRPANMARREGVSPAGASIAFVGFGGAPQSLTDQYQALFGREAKARDISLAESKKANYLVRGYLSAATHGAQTEVACVFDVFDANRQRAQRIEDRVTVDKAAADPWSAVDQSVLTAVAAKSADDLANFLTNTPEAVAANDKRPADSGETTVAASVPGQPAQTPRRETGFAALH